jgi:phospholipid/cholesterol/gamma-HCH transport system ATP-binding protein
MSGEAEPVIRVRDLYTCFGAVCVHEALDLDVRAGEVLGLVGGSGSGKTTLLRELIMLVRPARGSIRLFGQEVVGIRQSEADRLRGRFGVMFQHGALFSSLSVLENVAVPLREHTDLSPRLIEEIGMLKIALAGLPASAAGKYPRELSGGMVKPSAGLDPVSASALDELVVQLKESLGLTVLSVTHDLDSLWRTTDRVAFLGERRVVAVDSMRELARCDHPLVRSYFQGPRGRAALHARGG